MKNSTAKAFEPRTFLFLAAGIVTLSLVAIILFLIFRDKGDRIGDEAHRIVHFYTSFSDERRTMLLRDEVKIFTDLEKQYEVNIYDFPAGQLEKDFRAGMLQPPPDIIVTGAPASFSKGTFFSEPHPWYGRSWVLYYNKAALKIAGIDPEHGNDDLSFRFSTGDITWNELIEVFGKLGEAGITPISVGGKFGWPIATWIQHIVAVGEDSKGAAAMLSDSFLLDSSALDTAIALFAGFIEKNWVWARYQEADWPEALIPLISGKAAFCLLSESLVTSIPAESREGIGFLPFPTSGIAGGSSWSIGSIAYLAIPAKETQADYLKPFFEFLISQGSTSRLRRSTLAPFFTPLRISGDGESGPILIPSITSKPNSPLVKYIHAALTGT